MDQTTSSNQSCQQMIATSTNNNASCRINKAKLLGSGSYGSVYLGHLTLKNIVYPVAVKKVEINSLTSDMHTKALQNQYKSFKTIPKSSHILKLYQFIKKDNINYFIMEKCNEDFSKYWKKMEKDETTIKYYFKQIVLGYSQMYKSGIVHHDLKPENILVNSENYEGILKIADFGLAQEKGEQFVRLNMTWQTTSPEVRFIKQGGKSDGISHKSDMWALGCILYWMIYNSYPYRQSSVQSDYSAKPIFPDVSPQLHKMLFNLLQYNPHSRWDFPTLFSQTSSIHIEEFDEQFLSSISNLIPIINQPPVILQDQFFFLQQQLPYKKLIKLMYQKTRSKISLLELLIQKLRPCPLLLPLKKILIQSLKCLISLLYSSLISKLESQISSCTQQNDKNFINYFIIYSKEQIHKQKMNIVEQNNLKKKYEIEPWLLRANWNQCLALEGVVKKIKEQVLKYLKQLTKIEEQKDRGSDYYNVIHYLIMLFEIEKLFVRIEDEEDYWKKIYTWRKKSKYFRVDEAMVKEYLEKVMPRGDKQDGEENI